MKSSLFFWGSFLIFLGTFLLMNNFGIFEFSFSEVVDWWPLMLIIWGVSLLKVPQIVKNILMALSGVLLSLIIVTLFTSGFNFVDNFTGNIDISSNTNNCTNYSDKPADNLKIAKLNFSGGAGSFNISDTDEYLYYLNSGSDNCVIDSDYPNDSTVVLNYSVGEGEKISGASRYTKLQLSNQPNWDIDISAGAANLKVDFQNLKLANLNIDAGATNADLTLSAKLPITKVNISCGAATFKIKVPKDIGCSVQGDMALSKTKFTGLTKNSAGVYISENYYESINKIDFNIDGALSKFDIERK